MSERKPTDLQILQAWSDGFRLIYHIRDCLNGRPGTFREITSACGATWCVCLRFCPQVWPEGLELQRPHWN